MSRQIERSLTSDEIRDLMLEQSQKYTGRTVAIHPYITTRNRARVPFAWKRPEAAAPATGLVQYEFKGELREQQKPILARALDILQTRASLLLSTHVGFGKTVLGIRLLSLLREKTFVLVHRVVLIDQWARTIERLVPGARVQCEGKYAEWSIDTHDIFVLNITNVSKVSPEVLDAIGVVIIDEAHTLLTSGGMDHLLCLTPKFLIGLTATPYRLDGTDRIFELFFGPPEETLIMKPLFRRHSVYRVDTRFLPRMKSNADGRVNWGLVLKDQARDEKRNALIVQLIREYDYTFLILCKLTEHVETLAQLVRGAGFGVQTLYGASKKHQQPDPSCRIIIGTVAKLAGFDDTRLDALIIAADLQAYFIQHLGRVFRDPDREPVVFDLVDARNPILLKHYRERVQVYEQAGGIIYRLQEEWLDTPRPLEEKDDREQTSPKNNHHSFLLKTAPIRKA